MDKFIRFTHKYKYLVLFFIVLVSACLISPDIYARMGGAGGSSNSSGGDGGLGELIFFILMLIPAPYNYIVIALLLIGYFVVSKLKKRKSILNKIPSNKVPRSKDTKGISIYQQMHPDFKEEEFIEKVKTAFTEIQNAWASKDIKKVRRFITDGMYQRVNTQFKMMSILSQNNILEKLSIKSITIDKIKNEGDFDTIHVGIMASVKDKFISDKYPNLNESYFEEFVEYWSFIRKSSATGKDMYSTYNCPNCGGDLSNSEMGDVCQCPYCRTFTNSGEFDWVLAEITQADDYFTNTNLHDLSNTLTNKIDEISEQDENFAVQLIEDKASNGYLQLQTARVFKKLDIIQRFVDKDFYAKFKTIIETEEAFVYNRIYINDVTLIGALQKGDKNILALAIKSSFQRVRIVNNKVEIIDHAITSKNEVIMMSKDIVTGENKGSLYANQCPSCGGTISDTTDMNCSYCGNVLNSSKNEWIVSDLMSSQEYLNYYKANTNLFIANVNPKKLDAMYKVRDYAFNNVLVMIAADGVFDVEEIDFANKLAKKWGYAPSKIQGMIEMARQNQLILRMPDAMKDRKKIYKLMYKTAAIDGNISPEEQNLLDNIKNQYL